jgi:hypothetical protein
MSYLHNNFHFLVSCIVLVVAASCASSSPTTETRPAPEVAASPVVVDRRPVDKESDDDVFNPQSDEQITAAVTTKLHEESDPALHGITVSTAAGVVTLSGAIDSIGSRNVAVGIANAEFGVVRVVPDLVVGPAPEGAPD